MKSSKVAQNNSFTKIKTEKWKSFVKNGAITVEPNKKEQIKKGPISGKETLKVKHNIAGSVIWVRYYNAYSTDIIFTYRNYAIVVAK